MAKRELNRKQRKARWINAKNLMLKYPEAAYGGDFYCNHVYEPAQPWVWVDFRFFHSKLKRYFSVAMTTLEYREYEKDSEKAYGVLEESVGQLRTGIPEKIFHPKYGKCFQHDLTQEDREFNDAYFKRLKHEQDILNSQPRVVRPSIEIKNYGSVAVGVWASVDAPYIDEHHIRKFIKFFRDLGEPIKPGWTYVGEEVEVIPSRINDRF